MKQTHLIKPVLDGNYPTVSYGKGIYLYDTAGKRYLDGSSGAVTASIGHGIPEIVQAMTDQAGKVAFSYRSQFTNKPAEELASRLSQLTPGDLNWSFFVNSGSEATETAMKIAIQYWQERGRPGKNRMISRWMSYHGITMGALSMSGHVLRRKRFVSLLQDYPSVSAPYSYRSQTAGHGNETMIGAQELEASIHRTGKDNIAAFIAEPIIGAAGGAITPPDGYYQELKRICERHDILFIADEVMTGVGRTGKMLAMEHWGVTPDLVALGKGMSAGYTPIAAALVSDKVMEPILKGSKSIMAGHTYSANPLSAAISVAVLDYMERHRLIESCEDKGEYLKEKLHQLAGRLSIIGDVRGKGLLLGLEFVSDRSTKGLFPFELGVTERIIRRAFQHGLLVYPAAGGIDGVAGEAVIIAPPLTITTAEMDELVELLEKALVEIEQELGSEGHLHAGKTVEEGA